MIKANPSPKGNGFAFNLFGDPYGIRTHDTAVKGRCLNRLTKGPYSVVYRNALLKKSSCYHLVAAVRFEPTTCRV